MQSTASDEIKSVKPELLIVRAGAGAGKTTELVSRVLALARHYQQEHQRLPHLVVTTFTRKATQELKERLLQKALDLKDPMLVRFVQSPSHLHISTIHGVLSLYLIRYGAKIGLGPQFKIIDSDAEIKLIKKSIRQILKSESSNAEIDLLLEEQNLKTLLQSFQSYLEQRFSRQKPLAFFQSEEIQKLIAQQSLGWAEKATELLGHIESTQTGKNWPEYIAIIKNAVDKTVQTQGQDSSGIFNFSENRPRATLRQATEELKDLKSEVQDISDLIFERKWISSDFVLRQHHELATAFQHIVESLFQKMKAEKVSSGNLTMADLENFSLWLSQDAPESARQFSEEWDYWLVDEYQDTSPKQVEILKNLIGNRNSFTVGDPQQSIYLFRGARTEVFLQKEKEVQKQSGRLIEKMENYRSRPELLHFFNHFFQTYDSSQFHSMKPTEKTKNPELADIPCAFFIQADEKQEQSDQLAAIERMTSLLADGVPAEEICLLARSNKTLQEFARLCFQYKIPVQLHTGSGYRNRREILDAFLILKFLVNPLDNVNLIGLLRTPWFRISDQEIAKIAQGQEQSYWQNLQQLLPQASVTRQLLEYKQLADQIGFIQSWSKALVSSGIIDFSQKIDPSGRREANLMKLIAELNQKERLPGFRLLDFIYEGESMASLGLDTEGGGESDAVPVISPNRVNLMTVHASKGLQFQHVILIGVGQKAPNTKTSFFMYHEQDQKMTLSLINPETGKLQATAAGEEIRQTKAGREKQEMGRVLYVALTRAKLSVCLIWQKNAKSSWASQMWIPAAGEVQHEHFRTLYLLNHQPQAKTYQILENTKRKLPEKLQMKLPESNQSKSITELLSAGIENVKFQKQDAKRRVEIVQRGVEIHHIFESIKYREQLPQPRNENEKLVARFLHTDQGQQVSDWIKNGHVEWGFCVVENNIWFQGQIDLWTRAADGTVYVVDYKTGSKEYLKKAEEQLNLYAWALRKMKKISETEIVKTAVVYPFENEIQIGIADPGYLPGPLRIISP